VNEISYEHLLYSQDVDAATSARIALEKQLENLEVEIEFLQRVHKQVIKSQQLFYLHLINKIEMFEYFKPHACRKSTSF